MERCQARVGILRSTRSDGKSAGFIRLRSDVGVGVDGLPDGKQTIHVGVMEEEDGIEGAVGD